MTPEQILSERLTRTGYQLGTQLAIDNERPVAFIDPRHDSFDRLMSEHRCEHCTGSLNRMGDEDEEATAGGVILSAAVLLLCGFAFVAWMFILQAAQ